LSDTQHNHFAQSTTILLSFV